MELETVSAAVTILLILSVLVVLWKLSRDLLRILSLLGEDGERIGDLPAPTLVGVGVGVSSRGGWYWYEEGPETGCNDGDAGSDDLLDLLHPLSKRSVSFGEPENVASD